MVRHQRIGQVRPGHSVIIALRSRVVTGLTDPQSDYRTLSSYERAGLMCEVLGVYLQRNPVKPSGMGHCRNRCRLGAMASVEARTRRWGAWPESAVSGAESEREGKMEGG